VHSKTSYLAVKYRRIAARRGPIKAVVALEHTILTAVWNRLTTGEIYEDLGLTALSEIPQYCSSKLPRSRG
jgi:transposase